MKISEKQLLFLFHLLQDTLSKNIIGYLSTTPEARVQILNDIINQQDETLFEISPNQALDLPEKPGE